MSLKHKLHIMLYELLLPIYYKSVNRKYKRVVYLIGTEDYGNLGDHHIAYSQLNFLKDILKGVYIKEISASKVQYELNILKKYIKESDLICATGGGNFGNEYSAEYARRRIILSFPNNHIIIFPQTIYYTDDENGKKELEHTIKIFNEHKKLHLFVREQYSYKFAKEKFNVDVQLVPDIVLTSHYESNKKRDGITLCLRHDVERKISDEDEKSIIECVKKYSSKINITDTQLDYHVSVKNRRKELDKIIDVIESSKFVITDRLHGMVFCALTATPCIVMSNYNNKVVGVYEWIKELKYILFLEDIDELDIKIQKLFNLEKEDCHFPREEIIKKFKPLKDTLLQCWENNY